MAAGLAVLPDRVAALRTRLNELAARSLTPGQLQPALRLDTEVTLDDVHVAALRELERLHPLGQANPAVQVQVSRLTLARPPQPLGQTGQHLKLWVTDGRRQAEVVWWGGGGKPGPEGRFDLAAAPQINEFNGRTTVQLRLLDWRPAV
jgi:single-stranded-DNA-specific exonuclease